MPPPRPLPAPRPMPPPRGNTSSPLSRLRCVIVLPVALKILRKPRPPPILPKSPRRGTASSSRPGVPEPEQCPRLLPVILPLPSGPVLSPPGISFLLPVSFNVRPRRGGKVTGFIFFYSFGNCTRNTCIHFYTRGLKGCKGLRAHMTA